MKLEKGQIIEINISEIEKPVQAIVLYQLVNTKEIFLLLLTIHIFCMQRINSLKCLMSVNE